MINIRYMGYDSTHTSDFVFDMPQGHDCWLLLLTQTKALFLVDDELKEYPPNCAVLYRPNQRIYYRACEEIYKNDWIRFDTNETYVTTSPIITGTPFMIREPNYCHSIFQLLVAEHILDNTFKDISTDNLLRILFNKLFEATERSGLLNTNEVLISLYEFLLEFPSCIGESEKNMDETKSLQLTKTIKYIEDNYQKDI